MRYRYRNSFFLNSTRASVRDASMNNYFSRAVFVNFSMTRTRDYLRVEWQWTLYENNKPAMCEVTKSRLNKRAITLIEQETQCTRGIVIKADRRL